METIISIVVSTIVTIFVVFVCIGLGVVIFDAVLGLFR